MDSSRVEQDSATSALPVRRPALFPRLGFYGIMGAADIASTRYALRNEGNMEGNTFMRGSFGATSAMKLGAVGVLALADTYVSKVAADPRRKPSVRKYAGALKVIMRVGAGAAWGVAIANNVGRR